MRMVVSGVISRFEIIEFNASRVTCSLAADHTTRKYEYCIMKLSKFLTCTVENTQRNLTGNKTDQERPIQQLLTSKISSQYLAVAPNLLRTTISNCWGKISSSRIYRPSYKELWQGEGLEGLTPDRFPRIASRLMSLCSSLRPWVLLRPSHVI